MKKVRSVGYESLNPERRGGEEREKEDRALLYSLEAPSPRSLPTAVVRKPLLSCDNGLSVNVLSVSC
jgi:hypothetical protein